jgi:predicted kinase
VEAVLLIGLQAAGKTTFYQQRFAATHVRISLDQLKTRAKESAALQMLLHARLRVVIDNTNPSRRERARFILPAQAAGYSIIGYFFAPDLAGSLQRNALRTGKARVPVPGLYATRKRLEPPLLEEGFDTLWYVRLEEGVGFVVTPHPGNPGELPLA